MKKESGSIIYVAAVGEEPVVPEYDYLEVANKIAEIADKIKIIKHTLNLANATIGDTVMSVDTILIKMVQLNKSKFMLDCMRKQQPKTRDNSNRISKEQQTFGNLVFFKGFLISAFIKNLCERINLYA